MCEQGAEGSFQISPPTQLPPLLFLLVTCLSFQQDTKREQVGGTLESRAERLLGGKQ